MKLLIAITSCIAVARLVNSIEHDYVLSDRALVIQSQASINGPSKDSSKLLISWDDGHSQLAGIVSAEAAQIGL